MQVIRIEDCKEAPWKNGGGTTREIAVFPSGAGVDDFLWRLSMARVERAGVFSIFPRTDRVLTVLEGDLRLAHGGTAVELGTASAPFAFDGEVAFVGEPLGGAAVDLNAMVRRGRYSADVSRHAAGDVVRGTATTFFLALEPQALGGDRLDRYDCAYDFGSIDAAGPGLQIRFAERASDG